MFHTEKVGTLRSQEPSVLTISVLSAAWNTWASCCCMMLACMWLLLEISLWGPCDGSWVCGGFCEPVLSKSFYSVNPIHTQVCTVRCMVITLAGAQAQLLPRPARTPTVAPCRALKLNGALLLSPKAQLCIFRRAGGRAAWTRKFANVITQKKVKK